VDSWAWKAERLLEEAHGVKHAIVCANGTVALDTLVRSIRQQMFITPALTFSATVHGAGGYVEFRDVTIPECTMDASGIQGFPCLPVDLFGRQAEGFEKETIHDSCQAIGLRPLSNHGVWSFNGRKQVPAGEGGAIYTNSDSVADICRRLINHGENFGAPYTSGNGRMSEQTALLVYHGLKELPERQGHRFAMALRLNAHLYLYEDAIDFICPNLARHAMYIYPLIVPHSMPALAHELKHMGVQCQQGYIQPTLDQYPAFRGQPRGDLKNTYSLSRDRLLLFPQVNPCATEDEIDQLGESIVKAWRRVQ
jgi:dTDP-4-amino-4,6-dideoxygalactose transaminase